MFFYLPTCRCALYFNTYSWVYYYIMELLAVTLNYLNVYYCIFALNYLFVCNYSLKLNDVLVSVISLYFTIMLMYTIMLLMYYY